MKTTTDLSRKLFPLATELRKIHIQYTITTRQLTPVNYRHEKDRFLSSKRYNPRFLYTVEKKQPFKSWYDQYKTRIAKLSLPPEVAHYLYDYLHNTKLLAKTYESIGSESFARSASLLFSFGSVSLKSILTSVPKPNLISHHHPIVHDAPSLKRLFVAHLNDCSPITESRVNIDFYNDHMIRVSSRHLTIGAAVKRSEINARRLIVHEIESHMLQRYNLLIMKNPLLTLSPFHLSHLYGEGLAVYNEVITGTITKSAYENYILRLRAVEHINKSFREIYDILRSHGTTSNKAFMNAYRVKRGLPDTAKPGGFPKDASYLLGYKEVYDFIKRGGRYESLYLSRVPDLGQLLLKYNLLKPRHFYLPSFYRKQYQ
ncbi:DUF1704 domain-containing protein [Candidatus Roizmanbacteria bacterium]|nr:DUF1704 domain-containing protein [Candidatus Roizmanbacteria bacterium]